MATREAPQSTARRWSPRELVLQLHLWLGLPAGLVIAIVCGTGAILTFQTEIEMALHPERHHVEPEGPRLPLDDIVARAGEEMPGVRFSSITTHDDPRRSIELAVSRGDTVFAHPSTGAILGRHRFRETFLFDVFSLHRWLLAGDVGKTIVGVSTIVFLVILVSGLVLWWPKSARELRDRLRVKRTRNVARLIFDLHVSLGFYAAPFLFVMAFTGLAWSFQWFHDGIYWVTRSVPASTEVPEVVSSGAPITLESAHGIAQTALGATRRSTLTLPEEPTRAWTVRALPDTSPHDHATDTLHLDPYAGEVIAVDRHRDRSLGARTRATFYPIHVGSIFGMPTRVIAFVASLLGATFPITGFVMWLRKHLAKRRLAIRATRRT